MANRNQRRSAKTHPSKPVNAAPVFQASRNMNTKYLGAARFIELAPPGIQFRAFANVDHITNITFANKIEDIKIPSKEGAAARIEKRVVGWTVTISVGGQNNEFTFANLEVGVRYYHDILDSIAAIGVPCIVKPRIHTDVKEVSEKTIAEAVAEGLSVNEDHDDDDLISELQDVVDEKALEPKEGDEPTQH